MSTETQDTDIRVTPSFHPDTVRAIDEYDDDTASILSGVENAFTEAYMFDVLRKLKVTYES